MTKTAAAKFRRDGFDFEQIKRSGALAIYRQSKNGLQWFEVVRIRLRKPNPAFEAHAGFDAIESYPQMEAEVLASTRATTLDALVVVRNRPGSKEERPMDAQAIARLGESVTKNIELESKLFGSQAPVRIVEEQLRLNMIPNQDGHYRIEFDEGIYNPVETPIPGLEVKRREAGALPEPEPSEPAEPEPRVEYCCATSAVRPHKMMSTKVVSSCF